MVSHGNCFHHQSMKVFLHDRKRHINLCKIKSNYDTHTNLHVLKLIFVLETIIGNGKSCVTRSIVNVTTYNTVATFKGQRLGLPLKAFRDYLSKYIVKKYNLLLTRKRSILFDIDTLSLITDKVRLIFINICN